MFAHKKNETSFVHPQIQAVMSKMPLAVSRISMLVIAVAMGILYTVAYVVKIPVTVYLKPQATLADGRMVARIPEEAGRLFRTGQQAILMLPGAAAAGLAGEVTGLQPTTDGHTDLIIRLNEKQQVPGKQNQLVGMVAVVVDRKPLINKIFE